MKGGRGGGGRQPSPDRMGRVPLLRTDSPPPSCAWLPPPACPSLAALPGLIQLLSAFREGLFAKGGRLKSCRWVPWAPSQTHVLVTHTHTHTHCISPPPIASLRQARRPPFESAVAPGERKVQVAAPPLRTLLSRCPPPTAASSAASASTGLSP